MKSMCAIILRCANLGMCANLGATLLRERANPARKSLLRNIIARATIVR
jgi:hypothetical protein